MERDEAAATGHVCLDPEELGVRELLRGGHSPGRLWAELLERAFEVCGWRPGTVALAGSAHAGTIHEACKKLEEKGWLFRSGRGAVRALRRPKSGADLADARAAAAGTCEAMTAVAGALAAAHQRGGALHGADGPLTVGSLRSLVARVLAERGLEQPEGNIIAAGREAGVPHSRGGSDRVLRPGEALVVDLFPRSRLFADCSRTFCVGPAPEALARAHAAVEKALAEAHRAAAPGVSGWDLQQAACESLGGAGYPTPISDPGTDRGYVHGLGHGVGYELHELPSFRRDAGADGELREGDLFTLEPGLYEPDNPEGWGVRLEDLCYLRPAGVENLTPLPYALDPRAWVA